ncbi:hypothetical protein [Thiofilum flexile]|uniref:hypothetical protein n=1 Tax=Thiofilum flexile TaxID=125627 RepID=UPI00035C637A|nr:hypothetical protein [Thiofilum flexile]
MLLKSIRLLLLLLGLGFGLFWLSSYTHYSTIGIDSEAPQMKLGKVHYTYYRLWWPGNGAVLIGRGQSIQAYDPTRHYDRFDPAGTFLRTDRQHQPAVKTNWNRRGFWLVQEAEQFWLGVPAWLPVLIIGLLWWGLGRYGRSKAYN